MPKIQVDLKSKYNPNLYQFGVSSSSGEEPTFWQTSNIIEVATNGVYTVHIRNTRSKKKSTVVAIVNCVDGSNVCVISVDSLLKNIGCTIYVEKIVKLTALVQEPYSLECVDIVRVGSTGCRYEIVLGEQQIHMNEKTYNLKIYNSNSVLLANRNISLDTSVYSKIGTTLKDDGIATAGTYRFVVSTVYKGVAYSSQISKTFLLSEICSSNPCLGVSDSPEWVTSGSPYCDGNNWVVQQTQNNVCCISVPRGTTRIFTLEENSNQCTEGVLEDWYKESVLNPNFEMIIDYNTIIARFKNQTASGSYNGSVMYGNTLVHSQSGLTYDGFVEMSVSRYKDGLDLCGQYLNWNFTKNGHSFSFENLFTPKMVIDGHVPDAGYWKDSVLALSFKKPFNSSRFILSDYGNNLNMLPFYWINGTSYHDDNGIVNTRILSPEPIPANRLINVVKYLINPNQISNINVDGWKLFYASPQADKFGAELNFFIQVLNINDSVI